MSIDQLGIAVFGVAGIALANAKTHRYRKWASIFGLAGQGFWFYMATINKLWGVLVLSFVYTAFWGVGLYNNWIRHGKEKE